ncbi:MAG: Murein hydrolase activator NlpD precursor [Acidobacteria bacterium ADurb.Bin340]|nr:MAG: Murein hydrolase activator NlpD precursor [Acidobacteria bacterium ADurb.Bin340]
MRPSPFLLALALMGWSGSGFLEAARTKAPKARPVASKGSHKIRKGETAMQVARANGLTLAQLKALNPKVNLSRLAVGQLIQVGAASKASVLPKETESEVAEQERVSEGVSRPSDLSPITPLPGTPCVVPGSLTHLERVLPSVIRRSEPGNAPVAEAPFVAVQLQPVAQLRVHRPDPVPPPPFEPAQPGSMDLLWPVETRSISSAWGPRMRARTVRIKTKTNKRKRVKVRYQGNHRGVDLTGPTGSDIYAALDGRVVEAARHRQYGNYVLLDHGNGVTTLYAHNKANCVRVGDVVLRGQKIAELGRTGNATGPHLHFELRLDGVHQNPLPFMNDEEEIPAELVALNELIEGSERRR